MRCDSVGWPEMGSNFLSASAKRVEMTSVSIVCKKSSQPWGVGTAASDAIFLAIHNSISC